ncbi:MAG: Fic family protein [Cyanobacteria bacterium]|nr:Fic family protein [Cyanobacteriota bacterium]
MNQTPASNETKLGILDHVELNQHEAVGLKKTWDFLLNNQSDDLDSLLINKAHKHGFDFLYEWAGKYRTTTPLVGNLEPPAPHQITELMINLFNDLNYRTNEIDVDNLEKVVQLLAWFEHKFIVIHPYSNTNGRMGRLLTNFILLRLGYPLLDYSNRSEDRASYIQAMHDADNKDYERLETFIAEELSKAIKQNMS